MAKIVVIAALERELEPLICGSDWRPLGGIDVPYGAYESDGAVVICGGIGAGAARHAAGQAVGALRPAALISAGLAGALTPAGKVGQVLLPFSVLDAATGWKADAHVLPEIAGLRQAGLLVTSEEVAGPESKELLARQTGADWVDMEAAAVAAVAADHGIPFVAVKAISDESGFAMPPLQGCIDARGRFLTGRFIRHSAVRPALWLAMRRLAVNSRKAAGELCRVLRFLLETAEESFNVSRFQSFNV